MIDDLQKHLTDSLAMCSQCGECIDRYHDQHTELIRHASLPSIDNYLFDKTGTAYWCHNCTNSIFNTMQKGQRT